MHAMAETTLPAAFTEQTTAGETESTTENVVAQLAVLPSNCEVAVCKAFRTKKKAYQREQ